MLRHQVRQRQRAWRDAARRKHGPACGQLRCKARRPPCTVRSRSAGSRPERSWGAQLCFCRTHHGGRSRPVRWHSTTPIQMRWRRPCCQRQEAQVRSDLWHLSLESPASGSGAPLAACL